MTKTPRERRRYPRFTLDWAIEVAVAGGDTLAGRTVDISLVGAYVLLAESIGDLTEVVATIELPVQTSEGLETFTIALPGITVREEDAGDRFAVAIMFKNVPVESEWVLAKFLLKQIDAVGGLKS